MDDNELIAVLRLQNIPNIGDVSAKKLIAHCGSPAAVFADKREHLVKIDGIGSYTLRSLYDAQHHEAAEAELAYIRENNIAFTYFEDADHPKLLKHCTDSPILLFQRGSINLKNRKIISVVGTRNITSYGKAFCEKFIEEIAPLNPVIVSGFAYGVDITAQKAAVKHGLQTVGCLAHGLNQMYPKVHTKYIKDVEKNGGFFTEFQSTSHPERNQLANL